jgi:hypothetical protein
MHCVELLRFKATTHLQSVDQEQSVRVHGEIAVPNVSERRYWNHCEAWRMSACIPSILHLFRGTLPIVAIPYPKNLSRTVSKELATQNAVRTTPSNATPSPPHIRITSNPLAR